MSNMMLDSDTDVARVPKKHQPPDDPNSPDTFRLSVSLPSPWSHFFASLPAPFQPALSLSSQTLQNNSLYFHSFLPFHHSFVLLVTNLTSCPLGSSKDLGSGSEDPLAKLQVQVPWSPSATSISSVLPSLMASLFLSLYQLHSSGSWAEHPSSSILQVLHRLYHFPRFNRPRKPVTTPREALAYENAKQSETHEDQKKVKPRTGWGTEKQEPEQTSSCSERTKDSRRIDVLVEEEETEVLQEPKDWGGPEKTCLLDMIGSLHSRTHFRFGLPEQDLCKIKSVNLIPAQSGRGSQALTLATES